MIVVTVAYHAADVVTMGYAEYGHGFVSYAVTGDAPTMMWVIDVMRHVYAYVTGYPT